MATKTFEITEYKYGFFNGEAFKDKRMVTHLYQDDRHIAIINFQNEFNIPHTDDRGTISLYYRMEDLTGVIDMLRNEKPIFLHYDDRPKNAQAMLTTSKEPVGEGEISMQLEK
ncbi:hypothetical protein ACFL0O_06990 [Thermodesulfobacteriota bacterium]